MRIWSLLAALGLIAAPALAQVQDEAGLRAFQAAVQQLRTFMLRTGETVEGWDRGGADPDGDLRRLGADRFYMLNRGSDGAGVTILTDRPLGDFAPAGWRIVDSYGSAGEALRSPQLDFQPLSARYVIGARSDISRVNDVGCARGFSHALLYELPGAPATEGDESIPTFFRMVILALEDQTICVRSDGTAETGYTARFFLPDGRSLPAFDDPSERITIVPAAPIDRLIEPPPRPAPAAPPQS